MLKKRNEVLAKLKPQTVFQRDVLRRFIHAEYNKKFYDIVIRDVMWVMDLFFDLYRGENKTVEQIELLWNEEQRTEYKKWLNILVVLVRHLAKFGQGGEVRASFNKIVSLPCKFALPNYDEKILYYILRFRNGFHRCRNNKAMYVDCIPKNKFIPDRSKSLEKQLVDAFDNLAPAEPVRTAINVIALDVIYNMVQTEEIEVIPDYFMQLIFTTQEEEYETRQKLSRKYLKGHLRPKTWYSPN